MLSGHFDDPPDPTMRSTVTDRPVVELILALVDDDGRVDGNPIREALTPLLDQLQAGR